MERYSIGDLIKIGLRRIFWVFIPFTILLTIGLVGLDQVPARYHSKAMLIVADQQVSQDLVPSAIQAIAQDRLEAIKAEVRSRDNVVALAQQFQLFDPTSKQPFSEQVANIRADIRISIQRINTNRRRRKEASTITFEIGFVHENPQTAFRVANQLMTQFLAANAETRQETAESTAEFFRDESRDVRREIAGIRTQMNDIRRENPGLTPDVADFNRGIITRATAEIKRLEERIVTSQQSLNMLRMQQPLIIDANERNDSERVTLRERRRELTSLKSQYTESYPLVVQLTQEVLELERRVEPEAFEARAADLLDSLNRQIADREGLSRREVAELRERRDELQAQLDEVRTESNPQSLARLQFESREAAILQRIRNDEARTEELRAERAEAEDRLAGMPLVAAQLSALQADEVRLSKRLDGIEQRLATAEQTESLEEQQKAERVETLESPVVPDVPTSPDKASLAVMLAGAAGGAAAVLAFGPVLLFPRVDTGRQLGQSLPGVTVVEVPEIVDEEEQKFRRTVFVGLALVSVVLTLVLAFVAYSVLL